MKYSKLRFTVSIFFLLSCIIVSLFVGEWLHLGGSASIKDGMTNKEGATDKQKADNKLNAELKGDKKQKAEIKGDNKPNAELKGDKKQKADDKNHVKLVHKGTVIHPKK